MNTILVTNILLLIIVACFVAISILLTIALIHLISITRKIKHAATIVDTAITQTQSTLMTIKDFILENILSKPTRKTTRAKKK